MDLNADIELKYQQFFNFYEGYFAYFNTLKPEWKNKFVLRAIDFVKSKMIVGAEGFKPNNKVKAIIAASAVQLTLGLTRWQLEYFDTIIIHPSDFDNKPTGQKFKGETNLQGHIRFSWQSFISGYRVGNDKLNLGIHEFAHALRFNPIKGAEQDYFVEHYFNRWLAAANEAYEDIKNNRQDVFRKYGGTNINEFLSVCIEHYFESPQEIKNKYPMLYYCTAILLNQEKVEGRTELNIRRRLFLEKNAQARPFNDSVVTTKFLRTSSFKTMTVTSVPLLLTIFNVGFVNAGTMVLAIILFLFYLRFDYRFTAIQFHNDKIYLRKGFFIFKNRLNLRLELSQLISVKIEEEGNAADWEIVYFNLEDKFFYSEEISSSGPTPKDFIKQLLINKVAVFLR